MTVQIKLYYPHEVLRHGSKHFGIQYCIYLSQRVNFTKYQ